MVLNDYYIFPYENVPRNSKIIIYGSGNVGKCFWNQVNAIKYCNVLAVADQASNEVKEAGYKFKYNLISPDEISQYEYDYIVIAVLSVSLTDSIRRELVRKYSVDNNKIIVGCDRRTPIRSANYTLDQMLESKESYEKCMRSFWVDGDGDIGFFEHIIDEIRSSIDMPGYVLNNYKDRLISYLKIDENINNRYVILRILHSGGIMDDMLLKEFVDGIAKISSFKTKMWLLYDATVIESENENCLYKKYYIDKRRLIQSITSHLEYERPFNKKSNKVAIISVSLAGENSSHNQLIIPYANEMSKQGKIVRIFPINLFRYRYGDCFLKPIHADEQCAYKFKKYHEGVLDKNVEVFYGQKDDMLERIDEIMKELLLYNPSVVFDFCGEYSYISSLIHRYYPIVAMPMRGYSSSASFDVYLCRNMDICKDVNKVYHSIDGAYMMEGFLTSKIIDETSFEYSREDYNISEDAFVIVTAGTRLKSELSLEFILTVTKFLKKHNDAVWVIIGGGIRRYISDIAGELFSEGRIIDVGYIKDMRSFYRICDVYWNPIRMGSGGTIYRAMLEGIPIVTTDYPSDILHRIGRDNAIHGDYEDCLVYLEKLYNNEDYRREIGELMLSRTKISSVQEYVSQILNAGNIACELRGVV